MSETGEETKSFTIEDTLKQSESSAQVQKKKGPGITKEEAMLGLNIKKAELLPTGEIKLGNGKVLGLRKFHYIYKQRPRLPDTREATIINKIAIEQRRMKALMNGGVGDKLKFDPLPEFKSRKKAAELKNYRDLK